jgi:adenylate cyclase
LTFAVLAAFGQQLWIPLVPPLLGWIGAAGLVTQFMSHHERAERTVLNELFKRMISEEVVDTLWQRRGELLDEGQLAAQEVRATILFTDLEGFTSITELMDKSPLMAFLNDYMAVITDVVSRAENAFVNKYVGDAVMGVFGPPLERTEEQARADARSAVDCALEMRQQLASKRERWERMCAEGVRKKAARSGEAAAGTSPPVRVRMRIGIQSGIVVAGSLGSAHRLEYTVIGDTVNTAARLESYDKDFMPEDLAAEGCRILIGQDLLNLLPPGEYLTREVGSIKLKGKKEMMTIHGVLGRRQ